MAMTAAEKQRSIRLRDQKKKKTGAQRVADTMKRRKRKATLEKIASKIPLLGKAVIKRKKSNRKSTKY